MERLLDKPEKPLVFGDAGNVRLRIFEREDFWRNEFMQGFGLRATFTIFRWFYCVSAEGQVHNCDVGVILSVELSHGFILAANKKRNLAMEKELKILYPANIFNGLQVISSIPPSAL
jgi:hypothetical protein